MTIIKCCRGVDVNERQSYDLDISQKLSDTRSFLIQNNFIQSDSQNVKYRFVNTQSTSTTYTDAIISSETERLIPLQGVLGGGSQLILTNVAATSKPDLIGIGTTMFFNRYLGVSITLNKDDPSAVSQNDGIQAFPPMMLTNVIPTSTNVTGIYDNVCVCVEGSVVQFNLSSWGAVGYSEYISQDQGDPIVNDDLVLPMGNNPNTYASTTIMRYSNKAQTIQIVGADTANISPDQTLRFQKVVFRTRRITHYEQNGQSYDSQEQPPTFTAPQANQNFVRMMAAVDDGGSIQKSLANAGQIITVPGDSIKPGGPVAGPPSNQNWGGPVSNIALDDASQPLGEVVVYFFVFKSHADAVAVINGYNAPDPALWS